MRFARLLAALLLGTAPAFAADKPVLAPPGAWVQQRAAPIPSGAAEGAALKILMQDAQINMTAEGVESYGESVVRIQTPEGLAAMGTIALAWKPDTDTLTVHKLHILRDGKAIDVLGSGQAFTVLRRESNLEYATLDGMLTATIQPEGLRVGDIVDLAFTMKRIDPLFRDAPEWVINNQTVLPTGEVYQRATWDASLPIRWRATDTLPAMTESKAGGRVTLSGTMRDAQPAIQPKGAPPRFMETRQIELSPYKNWGDVSARLTPLYTKTAVIAADSPLRAELAAIKAASSDLKTRAEAALRLVQDRVRYVYLGMNDGNLVPAAADQKWARRFGDCKGKTTLLLALLHELGVAAEPVAASLRNPDGIDQRLPMVGQFDHVLVRATIAGKSYWLDGTRIGDRKLEDIPAFGLLWALPLTGKDAKLIAVAQPPLARPESERSVEIDASKGITLPALFKATQVLRGDGALAAKNSLANLTAGDLDRALRSYWLKAYDFVEAKTVAARFDEETGEQIMTVEGLATMDWGQWGYEIDGVQLGWKAAFFRPEGPRRDAQFALSYPEFAVNRETIRLPAGGTGFTFGTIDVDQTVAGVVYKRQAMIKDGVFTIEASSRSVAREFAASEAAAAQKALRAMNDVVVRLRPPENYQPTTAEIDAVLRKTPETAEDFQRLVWTLAEREEFDKAIKAASDWIAAKPDDANARVVRGGIYGGQDKLALARATLQRR